MTYLRSLFIAGIALLFMLAGSAVAGNDGVWLGMVLGVIVGFVLYGALWPATPPRRLPEPLPEEPHEEREPPETGIRR